MYPTLLGAKENTELVNGVDSALKKFLDFLGNWEIPYQISRC